MLAALRLVGLAGGSWTGTGGGGGNVLCWKDCGGGWGIERKASPLGEAGGGTSHYGYVRIESVQFRRS